jgi:hypothetical protein
MSLEIARPRAAEARIVVGTARYVLLPLANLVTGYSVKAMERKIERGDWQEGKVWRRAPDGRILIDVVGYQRWVEGQGRPRHLIRGAVKGRKRRSPCRWIWC